MLQAEHFLHFPRLKEAPVALPSMWWPLALDFLALRRSLNSSLDSELDLELDPALRRAQDSSLDLAHARSLRAPHLLFRLLLQVSLT